jgi:hypothetical protein
LFDWVNQNTRKERPMTEPKNSELSSRAGFGSKNPTEPPAVDVERQPLPDRTPETTSNINTEPPARSGPGSEATRKPTEGAADDNPIHHTGRMPPPRT